ncbi:MAG: tetratricopeptide repeat protein [Salibacteraceae bacterium]
MKVRVLFILTIFISMLQATAEEISESHYEDLFIAANGAYKVGAYDSAKSIYNEILSSGLESAELYYNLGNTHFKLGNTPSAILFYERANKLAPWDADIQYNLATARSFTADKIEPIEQVFFKQWVYDIASLTTTDSWAWWCSIFLSLCAISFAIFRLSSNSNWRQTALIATMVIGVISMVILGISSASNKVESREEAIVFSPTVNVKSEPAQASTVLFVVHEGVKIEVVSTESGWIRARFEDGNTGWLPAEAIEMI